MTMVISEVRHENNGGRLLQGEVPGGDGRGPGQTRNGGHYQTRQIYNFMAGKGAVTGDVVSPAISAEDWGELK
jgi:hypothetical protein